MRDTVPILAKLDDLNEHISLIAMVLILILTFAFGANGLNTDVIWFDELTSLGHMGAFDSPHSPTQILESIADKSSQHMPLFFLLDALWANLGGWSQASMRMISLWSGVLLIAWVYRFATDLVNRKTGIVSSLLLGSSAFVVVYFHEIRMYSLFVMLGVLHTWIYWRLAHSQHQSAWLSLAFIITTSALLYTHIFATVLFAGLGIYHIFFVEKSKRWLMLISWWAIGGLLFVPYIPTVIKGFNLATNKVSTFTTALSTPELLQTFAYLVSNGLIVLWIPFSILTIYGLWKTRHRMILRFLIVACIMFVTLVLINHRFGLVPLRRARYLLLMWFPIMIIFAYGLTTIRYWRLVSSIFVIIWLIAGYNLYRLPTFTDHIGTIDAVQYYPPMQDYVVELRDKINPLDYVVGFTDADFVNSRGKHRKSTSDYYMEAQLGIDGTFIPSYFNEEKLKVDIPNKLGTYSDLLLTYHPNDLPENFTEALNIIEETFQPCDIIINKDSLFVQRYVDSTLDCDRDYSPIHYENGVRILDKYIDYLPDSSSVRVKVAWEVDDERLLDEYNVSIQIITSEWQNVKQIDRHLYDHFSTWYVTELATDDLASGDYRVVVIIYDRETGEKVLGTDLITGEIGSILPIGVVTVGES